MRALLAFIVPHTETCGSIGATPGIIQPQREIAETVTIKPTKIRCITPRAARIPGSGRLDESGATSGFTILLVPVKFGRHPSKDFSTRRKKPMRGACPELY
jgi:hypothetical protein